MSGQNQQNQMITRPDNTVLATIKADPKRGVILANAAQAAEYAKMLAMMDRGVPAHVRGNFGVAFSLCLTALALEVQPETLANQSYLVNDRISYMSQMIHAIIERRAPLRGRLRATYAGSGDTRTCTVSGYLDDETEPFVYTSPQVGRITIKNSPQWKTDVDLQLWYYSTRSWARMYCPDVILGMYSEDELDRTPTDKVSALLAAAAESAPAASVTVTSERANQPQPEVVAPVTPPQAAEPEQPKPVTMADLEALVTAFGEQSVTLANIEEDYLGGDLAECVTTREDLGKLRAIYKRIKSGETWAAVMESMR